MSVLGPIDRVSPTWLLLKEHLEERLATERRKNDRSSMTIEDTQFIRGKIALLKDLLALDVEPSVPSGGEESPLL